MSWSHQMPWTRHMSSKRIFHQKNRKNNFMKETHKYAKRKKRESSEKKGPYWENAVSTQHTKKIQNEKCQTWRCYRPKYTLGGPGRPPQPEFASQIGARRANFSDNTWKKLRFSGCLSFCLFRSFFLFRDFLKTSWNSAKKKWKCSEKFRFCFETY